MLFLFYLANNNSKPRRVHVISWSFFSLLVAVRCCWLLFIDWCCLLIDPLNRDINYCYLIDGLRTMRLWTFRKPQRLKWAYIKSESMCKRHFTKRKIRPSSLQRSKINEFYYLRVLISRLCYLIGTVLLVMISLMIYSRAKSIVV